MKSDSKTTHNTDNKRIVYILERFPADTLNFVYNEIDVLEQKGFSIDIYSLLPSVYCPVDAEKYLDRTTAIKPVSFHLLLWAFLFYLVRRPLQLLSLFVKLPLENRDGFLHKLPRTVSHVLFGVYFAYLLRGQSDHIHAHFAHKAATAAYCAAKLNGASFSFTAHGSATIYAPDRYNLLSKIKEALFIVAISEFNKKVILGLCPEISPDRVVVNKTGIMTKNFPYFPEEKGLGDTPEILSVASLYPIKNHEGMIAAFGQLALAQQPFRLGLVGKDDSGRWAGLHSQAESLDIADQVIFHGVADHSTIAARLREADLMILTSHSEGIPVSLMEAMATGTPVLGPRVTGVAELVEEGVSGWLADPARPEEFTAVLEKIFSDRALLNSVRLPARQKVESDFDMVANAEKLAGVFNERIVGLN